jgi:glycine/D-amino acid oxidase-like deaminating enzyme
MILSAEAAVQGGAPLEAEIAIVGAGAVWIALAMQLAKGKHRIVVVEAGGPPIRLCEARTVFPSGRGGHSRHPRPAFARWRMT